MPPYGKVITGEHDYLNMHCGRKPKPPISVLKLLVDSL